jgi:predicted nucleotidyltransferase
MEYTIRKEDLQNDLMAETLQVLAGCYRQLGAEVFVVGAAARDIALRLLDVTNAPRRTMDLDVAVMLQDWNQYERLTSILLQNHFEKAREKQRFYYLGSNGRIRFEVDIVPFGAIAEDDQVAWPPEGSPVMSVRCFEDVMRAADKVTVDGAFAFRLASLSGQFLIKLDTWNDRRMKTKKDAADMAFLLQNVYVAYALAHDGLPPEVDTNTEQFDVIVAGAEWMAADLKKILSDEHRHFYAEMLRGELAKNEESPLLNDLLDVSDSRNYKLYLRAFERMAQILEK